MIAMSLFCSLNMTSHASGWTKVQNSRNNPKTKRQLLQTIAKTMVSPLYHSFEFAVLFIVLRLAFIVLFFVMPLFV